MDQGPSHKRKKLGSIPSTGIYTRTNTMTFKYGFMVVSPEVAEKKQGTFDDILHFVGYEEEPTKDDFDALTLELETDEEFELAGKPFVILEAPEMIVTFFREVVLAPDDE